MYICTLKGPGYHAQVNCRLKVNNCFSWHWGVKFGLDGQSDGPRAVQILTYNNSLVHA